jgi:activator of HSP90 ATPase
MPFEFSVSDLIPASAQDIYDAWLSSSGHKKITGGQKAQISAQEGAGFTVWNGYITGRNLKLEPGRRIVQSWRTSKFTASDPDSQIEVLLQPAAGGTTVTVRHSNVPDGHTSYRDGGWQRSYFEPMKQHFSRARGDRVGARCALGRRFERGLPNWKSGPPQRVVARSY